MLTLTRGGFAKAGSSVDYNTGDWRLLRPVHRHLSAPCHVACPAGEDPQAWLARIASDDLRGAWEALVRANPMPAITGRLCHHPCESACNRAQFDDAIAIHSAERFIGDCALQHGWEYPIPRPAPDASEVAVVGAGPAGLSAAYHLLRRGYRASLFEAQPEAGGLLRAAIPPYRLPRQVLDRELERLVASGVTFMPNQRLGRDVSLEDLRASFRAVFLAPGAERARTWSADGAVPADLHTGLGLLKEWISIGSIPSWRRVAIVGGGNTAIDLARVLKFAGVAEVHVITFQTLPGPGVSPQEAMSALPREIRQAQEEGVVIHDHRGVRRLILRGSKVVGVEMVHMKELARDSRREPVAFEGTEVVLHVDQVIPAIGQEVDPAGMESILGGEPFFARDAYGQLAGQAGVFVGGDACGGGGTVSGAIGDGRRAAHAIDTFIRAEAAPTADTAPRAIELQRLNLNYFEHAPRAEAEILEAARRTADSEIEGGLNAGAVERESLRCFSCGECMACDNCWTLCPDNAILKTRDLALDGSHYVFDYDHCKGCGLCAHECPVGFIAMIDEP